MKDKICQRAKELLVSQWPTYMSLFSCRDKLEGQSQTANPDQSLRPLLYVAVAVPAVSDVHGKREGNWTSTIMLPIVYRAGFLSELQSERPAARAK